MSNTPQELAALIRDVLHDRLNTATKEQLAFETAALRAFLFSTLDSIDHIKQHVQHNEIKTTRDMCTVLDGLTRKIENSIANLEDMRMELQHYEQTQHE